MVAFLLWIIVFIFMLATGGCCADSLSPCLDFLIAIPIDRDNRERSLFFAA